MSSLKFNVTHFEIIAFCLKIVFSNQYLISYVLTKQKMSKYCVSLNFYSACFMMYLRIRVVVITSKTTEVSFQNVSLSLKSINLLSGLGAPFFFRAMIISCFGKEKCKAWPSSCLQLGHPRSCASGHS